MFKALWLMKSDSLRLRQIMSILLTMNKHRLQSFTAVFYFTQAEHNLINLNYVKIDQRKLFTVFQSVLYVKFKEANKICSPSKISKSVNAEWSTCDRNNKGMYSCFYESKTFLDCLMQRKEKKIEDGENVVFEAFAQNFLLTSKRMFMTDFLLNELHEKGNYILYYYVI